MLSASIKLTNLHYFDALQQLALSNLDQLNTKPKLLQLPYYNFVCTLTDIITEYSKSQGLTDDEEHQIFNLNSFIVDFYFKKFEGNQYEIYRQFFSFLRSWKKYTEHHEDAKLFLSLLTPARNSKSKVRLFLKLRRTILKTINQKILQQLFLTHEDALTIIHTLFSYDPQIKCFVTKKINEMFISLKRKLVNSAKINGAVMCEFFMACDERFAELNINNLFAQTKNITQKVQPTRDFTRKRLSPLKPRQQNYIENPETLKVKNNLNCNLSFSEQFASYYSPPQEYDIQPFQRANQLDENCMNSYEDIEKEWNIVNLQKQAPINMVRNSLTFFKQKDKQIDEKINNNKKLMYNHKNLRKTQVFDRNGLQSGKLTSADLQKGKQNLNQKQKVIYPEGWENFIRTNELTKKKLMKRQFIQHFE